MQKSKANWQIRGVLKRRSRRWRRRQVVGFYFTMLMFLLCTAGNDHHTRRGLWWAVYGVIISMQNIWMWRRGEPLIARSLDDWAQIAHGANFDELSEAEQKEILRRYRVFAAVMDLGTRDETLDERQRALRLHAAQSAFRFLQRVLPWFVAVYWALYLWVPSGDWRDMLTDSPVLISWFVVFVVSLPQVIVMWTEPDGIGEARAVPTDGAIAPRYR